MTAMKGVCLNERGELTLSAFPVPATGRGMVKIRTRYAGICSTDVGYWENGSEKLNLPVILGHEMSGIVEEIGEDVSNLRVGQRVTVTNEYYLCGTCRFCRRGQTNMCRERRSIGCAENGAMAEYMVVPARMVLPLPEAVSLAEGALAEVMACGMHAMREMAHVKQGDVVLVMGPGVMGLSAAVTAQALGATVVLAGLHRDAARLEFAKKLEITHVADVESGELPALLDDLSEGYGADVAAECTGSYAGLESCLRYTAKCGCVVQLAIPHGRHEIDLSPIIKKELRYVGSYAKVAADWDAVLAMMAQGKLHTQALISDKVSMEAYASAFARVAQAKDYKILFDLNQ